MRIESRKMLSHRWQKKVGKLSLRSELPNKWNIIKHPSKEFQSSSPTDLVYKDDLNKNTDRKGGSSQWFHSCLVVSTTTCTSTEDPFTCVSMADLLCWLALLISCCLLEILHSDTLQAPQSQHAHNNTRHLPHQTASPLFYLLRASLMGVWPVLRRTPYFVEWSAVMILKFLIALNKRSLLYVPFALGPKLYGWSSLS